MTNVIELSERKELTNVEAQGYHILLKPLKSGKKEVSDAGIEIPEPAQEEIDPNRGIVLAIGPRAIEEMPLLKVGDKVVYRTADPREPLQAFVKNGTLYGIAYPQNIVCIERD